MPGLSFFYLLSGSLSAIPLWTTSKLEKYIVKKYPDLKKYIDQEVLRIAVNQEYIDENIPLNSDDEIAVFPPVSGG